MTRKFAVHSLRIHDHTDGMSANRVARILCTFDSEKVLKVGVGATPEDAVEHLCSRLADWMGMTTAEVMAIVRPIAFPETAGLQLADSGDEDDIPF